MILNELIKSGPLAKVWLSAHQERKLSKTQALGVDVGESVEAILEQDADLPLRSSGPLMLGVVRIYSRKVGYLFDDCKEARERISLAFRPGVVDLPEHQVLASHNAITISGRTDFDFDDWSWDPTSMMLPPETSQALPAIGARNQEFGGFSYGVPRPSSVFGGSVATQSRQGSYDESSSQMGSNDFSGVDLGLGDFEGDDTIEYGRDRMSSREGSAFGMGRDLARGRSGSVRSEIDYTGIGDDIPMAPMDDYDPLAGDGGYEPMDLELNFDQEQEPERVARASTEALTPPPATPPAADNDLTPRTAAQIAARPAPTAKPAKRPRLLMPDEALEIDQSNQDRSSILRPEHYIPANPELAHMKEIFADPSAHFLPVFKVGGENWTAVAPLGAVDDIIELFSFPSNVLRKGRALDDAEDEQLAKRARLEGRDEADLERGDDQAEKDTDDVEIVRRRDDFRVGVDPEDDGGAPFVPDAYDMSFDVDPMGDMPGNMSPIGYRASRAPSLALSRAESIAREIQYGANAGDFALAMFDSRHAAESQMSQLSQATSPSRGRDESTQVAPQGRNSSMAMGLLRKEINAIEEGEKRVSFEKLANNATKRAASAFFFEMLSLGTRDCVKLEQPAPFGDIKISAKDKLWPSSSQIGSEA
ncbi:hypothetical protein IAR50_006482 [Cryptococcus sp. DSM 104548]